MRKTLLALTCFALAATAASAQEDNRNSVTVSAFGAYQQDANGNGIQQSAPQAPGVLFTYRYFFTAHQGLEVNYGFTRLDETFSTLTSPITSNTHEANAAYVLRLPSTHLLSPFVSAGVGALVFSPTSAFTVNSVNGSSFATPDFVYSAGADLALSHRVSLRFGYRGHVFEAPDYGISSIATNAVTHMAEPFAGLSFHF